MTGNNPFRITPDARFFHRGRAAMASHDSLLEGVEERHGVMLLVGEPGTGKTTLLLNLQIELESAGCLVVFPRRPMLSFDELIQACCAAAGLSEEDAEGTDKVRTFTDLLVRQVDEGGTTAIFIDDAHTVSDEFLVDLSRLTKIEKSGKKLLQVVLSGQLELVDRLTASNLPFVQECAIAYRSLDPLGKTEVGDYIKYRLGRAGHKGPGFSAKAIKRIGHLSNGVPQVINQLCGMCLQMAEFENAKSISLAQVDAVAEDLLDELVAPTPTAESKAPPESAAEEEAPDEAPEEAAAETAAPQETSEPSPTARQAVELEEAALQAETSDDKGAWLERAFADEVLGPEGLVELEAARQDAARLRRVTATEEAGDEDDLDPEAPEFESVESIAADPDEIDIDWASLEAGLADRGQQVASAAEPPSNVLHLRVEPPLRTPDRDDHAPEPVSPRAAVSAMPRRISVAAMFLFGLLFGGMTVGATWVAGGQGIGPLAWLAADGRPTALADAKPEVAPDEAAAAVESRPGEPTPVGSEPAIEPAPVLTAEADDQQPQAKGAVPGEGAAEDAPVQPSGKITAAGGLGETAQENAGTAVSPPAGQAEKVAAIPIPKPPIPKPAAVSSEQPASSEQAIAGTGQDDSLAADTVTGATEPAAQPSTPTTLAAVATEPEKPAAIQGVQSQGVSDSTGATRTGAIQNGADLGKPANAPTSLLPSQAIISRFESAFPAAGSPTGLNSQNGSGGQAETAPALPDSVAADASSIASAEPSQAAPASAPTSLVGFDRDVTIEAAPAGPQVQTAEGLEVEVSGTSDASANASSSVAEPPAPIDLGRPTQLLPAGLQQNEQVALATPTLPQREPVQPDTLGHTTAPAPSTEAVAAPASLLPPAPPGEEVVRAPVGGLLAVAPSENLSDGEEYRLQFASLASRLDAERERDRLVERHWDLLGDYDLRIAKGDVEGRSFYRIRSTPLGDGEMAYDTCDELGSRGQGCMVLRGDTVIRSIDPLPGSNGEPNYGADVKVAGALGATAAVEGGAAASSAAFSPQGDMTVLDFLLTRNVEDREPIDRAAGFAAADREGYAYARIKNVGSPTKVAFLWRRGEQLVSRYRTTIGTSGRWRTWSSTELWPGSWSVAIVKEGGEVLAETNFVVE